VTSRIGVHCGHQDPFRSCVWQTTREGAHQPLNKLEGAIEDLRVSVDSQSEDLGIIHRRVEKLSDAVAAERRRQRLSRPALNAVALLAAGFSFYYLIWGSPYEYKRTRQVKAHSRLAKTSASDGDFAAALEHLRDATVLDPGNEKVLALQDRYDLYERFQKGQGDAGLEGRLRLRIDNEPDDLEAVRKMALLLQVSGRHQEALSNAEKVVVTVDGLAHVAPDEAGYRIGALAIAVECAVALGDLERAHSLATRLRLLAEEAGDPRSLGHSRLEQARLRLMAGDPVGARKLYEDALGYYRSSEYDVGTVNVLVYMAHVDSLAGDNETALVHLEEAAVFAESIGRDPIRAHILHSRSELPDTLGRFEEAEGTLWEAYAAAIKAADPRLEANILLTRGALYVALGKYADSVGNFNQALRMYRRHGMQHNVAMALVQAAAPMAYLGIPEAQDALDEARAIYPLNPIEDYLTEQAHNRICEDSQYRLAGCIKGRGPLLR